MNDRELQEARDHVWHALSSRPLRRSMVGRQQSDAIVRVALESCELRSASGFAMGRNQLASAVEEDVWREYQERNGFVLMTMLLGWAITAIVQALVTYWLNNRGAES